MIVLASLVLASAAAATVEGFRIEEVGSVATLGMGQIKPKTIVFSDHKRDQFTDPETSLIRFEDWARTRPAQKQVLSLYPGYVEPTVSVTLNGLTKTHVARLQMYVAEARFLLDKPPSSINLAQYATLAFLERVDPTIKHRLIAPSDVVPAKDANFAYNLNPSRPWCEVKPTVLCIQSRYQFEGRLPAGISLANKLRESGRKIADFMEFQSELRLLSGNEVDQKALTGLTGIDTPITGALEQSIFYVNQVMQFGKFLAVFQPYAGAADKTIVTAFMALAVESDILEKKREYENVPVLRNLVPALVLAGKSSFNTGTSLSAGLPTYTRNRIQAITGILEGD